MTSNGQKHGDSVAVIKLISRKRSLENGQLGTLVKPLIPSQAQWGAMDGGSKSHSG